MGRSGWCGRESVGWTPRTRLIGHRCSGKGGLDSHQYIEGRKGGFDPPRPHPLIWIWMALMRFLYSLVGLFQEPWQDPNWRRRLAALQPWLRIYCQPYLPSSAWRCCPCSRWTGIEADSLCRQELGMRAVPASQSYNIACRPPATNPFWAEARNSTLPLACMKGPAVCRRWASTASGAGANTSFRPLGDAVGQLSVIWGGVCDVFEGSGLPFF